MTISNYNHKLKESIRLSYMELYDKYDDYPNDAITRHKLINDMSNKIKNKCEINTDFIIICDETNNPIDIINRGHILVEIMFKIYQSIEIKEFIFIFGDSSNIIFPPEYNVYLRRRKINKLINK